MNISEYIYQTELHSHTYPCSSCSQIPPEEVIRIYAELGYTSIVISNHFNEGMRFYGDKQKAVDTFLVDFDTACRYGEKYSINVILGCEIRFTENANDYLLYGIDRNFLYAAYEHIDSTIAEFSEWFRNDSRLLIQAHPFRNNMTDVDPALLDGIETFNMHPGHNSRIAVAAKYAAENDFIVACGTDYHHPTHEGMAALLTREPVTSSEQLADILRSRDYLFRVSGHIVLPYGGSLIK